VLRSTSKRWFKKALVRSPIFSAARRFFPPAAVILSYHSILEEPEATDHILGISQSRANFEAHMKALAQHFSPVTVEDVAQFARSGRELPARAVAVTFDDGFADNYEVALPILKRYGIPRPSTLWSMRWKTEYYLGTVGSVTLLTARASPGGVILKASEPTI